MSEGEQARAAGAEVGANVNVSAELCCPRCGSSRMHREERKGFLQKKIYSLFGFFPWRCSSCGHYSMLRKRYRRSRSDRKNYTK